VSPQLLLFAEPLVASGLLRLLADLPDPLQVVVDPSGLQGAPALVLWRPAAGMAGETLRREALLLRERWRPAPLLVLLPPGHGVAASTLLELAAHGLLEAPGPEELLEAIRTLRAGGRVLQLQTPPAAHQQQRPTQALGLGQKLLVSGLEQIEASSALCRRLLDPPPAQPLQRWALEGRLRELACARQLLLLLWGPVSMAWDLPETGAPPAAARAPGGSLTLQQRNAAGIWRAVRQRLETAIATGLDNRSGQLLAIDGLHPERCRDLLLALLDQLESLRGQLATEAEGANALLERWLACQPQLREQALRAMASPYVQLPRQGALEPVARSLIAASDLTVADPELPDLQPMLATLVLAQPLLVEGQLVPADELRAVLHLERLVANWLVRTAELLAADVLACCGGWPELRRYLLRPELLATRNLERLRNQLNAQQRWGDLFERPIAIYESRRQLLCVDGGAIAAVNLLEPRDAELQRLGPLQQLVTLALETRDAVAPQLRQLIQGLGNLVVVLLTEVVGRAIGLVGRGVLQGMGRRTGRP
jgi:DNA-binding NarL/FixJ family response regulator